jgi:hypothetical protein
VVPELKAKVHAEVAKELDRAENEGRPTVTVIADKVHGEDGESETSANSEHVAAKNESIDFGRVRFREHKTRNVTIANTGQVPATMSFVNRPSAGEGAEAEGPSPPWLAIEWDRPADPPSPSSPRPTKSKSTRPQQDYYTLDPGDACNVTLTVRVEALELTGKLNDGTATLEDILILRVQDGRDHFLPVTGRWLRSGLERTVDVLTNLSENTIRKLQSQEPTGGRS